jgi:regulator of protease activity HflC (stomatin/prohibitin superfamily)
MLPGDDKFIDVLFTVFGRINYAGKYVYNVINPVDFVMPVS